MPVFSYDIATPIGKTRLFCLDTSRDDHVFSDSELQVFLDTFQGSPMLAAAFALDTIATDAARVAVITKNDNQSTDPSKMPELIAARAANLRRMASSDPEFVAAQLTMAQSGSPDRIFTTDDTDTGVVGTMTGW